MTDKTAYPLNFPSNWKRTLKPEASSFGEHSIFQSINPMKLELIKLGATEIIISSNLELQQNGMPYSNRRNPSDCGVAVYFKLKGKEQCFPCDRWNKVEHNLWAIYKSIKAIRGLERWGAKTMVEAAFTGFQALPSPEQVTQTKVRYFQGINNLEQGREVYKNLVLIMHPDKGGTQEEFMELQKQYNQFKSSMETI